MGLQGFSNNSSGGMSPGDNLYAKAFNNLAASADKAQVGPSPGLVFNSTNGGLAAYIPQVDQGDTTPYYEQFQIVLEPITINGNDTNTTLLRVVKGSVVWKPIYPEDSSTESCTTQYWIDTFYALPYYPIFPRVGDDIFISGGGVIIPNGLDVGVFIFKCDGLETDTPPIIAVMPKGAEPQGCPVGIPFTPPVAGGKWQKLVIGYVNWVSVNEVSYFKIDQKLIGSLTFPGGGAGTPNPPYLPPQLPAVAIAKGKPHPFECKIEVDSSGEMLLKVGTGTISFTKSNMPYIQLGAFSNKFQYEYTSIQAVPQGWRKPGLKADGWMETGGGYKISGEGQWYLVAAYWDVGGGSIDVPTPLKSGLPSLFLVDAYDSDVDKLFVETGPGLYTQTMNIQPMEGYKAEQTELNGDWMHCHSTWFNPTKFGYDVKMIARIESQPGDTAQANVFTYQLANEGRNMIQNIYFPVLPKDGFVMFTYDGFSSGQFYPSPWSGFNDATNLFEALQVIPALKGNIVVTRTSEQNFYVTFINALQATNVPLLVANNSALVSWDNKYVIDQYITGNIVLDTEPKFNGTQIMNRKNITEAEDPYTVQANLDPAFSNVVNYDDMSNFDSFSGDTNFSTGAFPVVGQTTPRTFTINQPSYLENAGCDPDLCEHPFQVHKTGVENETSKWSVCLGTVNNMEPSNKDTIITLQDGYIWLKCTASNTQEFPIAVTLESGGAVPADTDTAAYVLVAKITAGESKQLLSGSVWADRIKVGNNTATYYYAGI